MTCFNRNFIVVSDRINSPFWHKKYGNKGNITLGHLSPWSSNEGKLNIPSIQIISSYDVSRSLWCHMTTELNRMSSDFIERLIWFDLHLVFVSSILIDDRTKSNLIVWLRSIEFENRTFNVIRRGYCKLFQTMKDVTPFVLTLSNYSTNIFFILIIIVWLKNSKTIEWNDNYSQRASRMNAQLQTFIKYFIHRFHFQLMK